MKKRGRMISLLLAALLAFPAAPLSSVPPDLALAPAAVEAAAKEVKVTNAETGTVTIQKGETFQLKANRSDVTWKSSNQKVVTVSASGKLKGIKKGTAKITAKAGTSKAVIEVTVGTKVTGVNVIKSAVALPVGGKSTIKAEVTPADASNKALVYVSADAKTASVSKDGVITAKKAGSTKITVRAADGSKQKEVVYVSVRAADSEVRPQDDFYQAINAELLNAHPLREDQGMWSNFGGLQEEVTKNLNSLIDGLAAEKEKYTQGSIQQKVIDFYLLARDMETRDKAGVEPLRKYIDQIDQAQTPAEFVDVLAQLSRIGVNGIINFGIAADIQDSNKYVLYDQGPECLLTKEYYTQTESNQAIQQALLTLVKQMFVLAGESEEEASKKAAKICEMQQEFAMQGLGLEDRYDVEKIYNPYTKEELAGLYSNCDILKYLETAGVTSFDTCIVQEVENVKKVNSYLTPEHLDDLKDFQKFIMYTGYSNYLTSAHYKALLDFDAAMTGSAEQKDADTVAKELTQSLFSWEFGKLYTDQYFSEESKQEVEGIAKQLLATFRSRIEKIDWLSDTTKQKAIKKLDTMKLKIGYPDQWPSYYDNVSIDASKGLIENIVDIMEALNGGAQKQLDNGVDKKEWGALPQMVNAFYNPQANDITFPAAILQEPFYRKGADAAENLGGIGTVIGHEITHAFDNNGARYDENGNFVNWWTQEDLAQFQAKAQKVMDYYSSIEVANGLFQNGEMTVGENIADMGAMACILDILGDDKEAQRKAFESNAKIWASNQTDQFRDYLLMADAHSLNKVRVNAVLPLFDEFYEVYGVTKKDAMYVAPEDRVKIW
ncbi:MAG: Ig-like domain-containing protein [Eubacterium sp.]|nr:Ig-like domain-containing protein [Eubacterium sp.]